MGELIVIKASFIVFYGLLLILLYFLIAKRLDVLTDRNEYKIGERIIPLEKMKDRQKWGIKFTMLLMFIASVITIVTLL